MKDLVLLALIGYALGLMIASLALPFGQTQPTAHLVGTVGAMVCVIIGFLLQRKKRSRE